MSTTTTQKPQDKVFVNDPKVVRLDPTKFSDHRQTPLTAGAVPPIPGKYTIPQHVNKID
jgi:hypothetical protein